MFLLQELRRKGNDYYPFGLTFNSYQRENSVDQKYLYNGKELQDELDLGWLDFGARMYDAAISRWASVDPHSHEYYSLSPYNGFVNNPVLFTDPSGRDIVFYMVDSEGARKKVGFKDLDKNYQKALSAFVKTKEGREFLGQYAKTGDQ